MWPVTSRISTTWEPVRNAESSLHLEPWNPKLHFTKFSRPFTRTWTFENCCHGPSLTYRPGLMLNAILSYSSCPCTCLHCVQNHNHCGFQWSGTNQTSLSSLLTALGEIRVCFLWVCPLLLGCGFSEIHSPGLLQRVENLPGEEAFSPGVGVISANKEDSNSNISEKTVESFGLNNSVVEDGIAHG